jgi:GDP-L-fucose synthase
MNKWAKIYVTGHRGLVGSALVRALKAGGHNAPLITATHDEVDLTDPVATKWFFSVHQPEYVFHCAARVGGIQDNIDNSLEFFLENMKIEMNVLGNAADYGVKKLLFLGSSCVYPADCPKPIKEESLLTGPFQKEVEAYGLAKVCGIRLCQWYKQKGHNFVSAMPCNIYGIGDTFNTHTSHCVPGLIARMYSAKISGEAIFKVWGDGKARRELLFADDLAEALLLVMEKYDEPEPINTGSGHEYSVCRIAHEIERTIEYLGKLEFDPAGPVGATRKLLDNSKIFELGWTPRTPFDTALRLTYQGFLQKHS